MTVLGKEVEVTLMILFSSFSFKVLNLLASGDFLKMIRKFQGIVLSGYLANLRSKG